VLEFIPLRVRDCQGLLWALLREYEGRSQLSLEGDLSALRDARFADSSMEETGGLKRQTLHPELDFLVVPVTAANVRILKPLLSRPAMLGRDGSIVHVQLAVDGTLALVACDNFHDDCTAASNAVSTELLTQLTSKGVLRGWGVA